MNGQGLGGVGFSGGIGQPGATGMGPGNMGGGFSGGGILSGGLDPMFLLELMGYQTGKLNGLSPTQKFSRDYGLAATPDAVQRQFLKKLVSGGFVQAPAPAPATPALNMAPAPAVRPGPLAPVTPASPYTGLLGQQSGGQGGYGGLLSRMMSSPNRQMLRRPGIA